MDKFANADIINSLRAIMNINTIQYKTDFDIVADNIQNMAKAKDAQEKTLLWYSRPSGTQIYPERQVFQEDTPEHSEWSFHHEETSALILAYAVEIKETDTKTGIVTGNIYELDYHEHAEMVRATALPSNGITVFFENGESRKVSIEDFNRLQFKLLPPVAYRRNEPESPAALTNLLKQEQIKREETCVLGDWSAHLSQLRNRRLTHEAGRIKTSIQEHNEPNSPNKTHFMAQVSGEFIQNASSKDLERLRNAIPYKSAALSNLKGKTGIYALVPKSEVLNERKEQVNDSVLGQLQNGKKAVLQYNDAEQTERKHSVGQEV